MNRKLQILIDEFISELQARLPSVRLEPYPRGRKSADIYMIAPHKDFWDDDMTLAAVESMGQKQIETLVRTGYSIHLLRHYPQCGAGVVSAVREEAPQWQTHEQHDKDAG